MSHGYSICCEKCNVCTDDYNRAEAELIDAIKDSMALWVFSKSQWYNDSRIEWKGLESIGSFIVKHFTCGRFAVVSEYHYGNPTTYPKILVQPHGEQYRAICLEAAVAEAKELIKHLESLC